MGYRESSGIAWVTEPDPVSKQKSERRARMLLSGRAPSRHAQPLLEVGLSGSFVYRTPGSAQKQLVFVWCGGGASSVPCLHRCDLSTSFISKRKGLFLCLFGSTKIRKKKKKGGEKPPDFCKSIPQGIFCRYD